MSRPAAVRTHRAECPNRRPLLIASLLVALTSVPTAIVVVAGAAAIEVTGPRARSVAQRPVDGPLVVDRGSATGTSGAGGASPRGGAVGVPDAARPPLGPLRALRSSATGGLGPWGREESGGLGGGTVLSPTPAARPLARPVLGSGSQTGGGIPAGGAIPAGGSSGARPGGAATGGAGTGGAGTGGGKPAGSGSTGGAPDCPTPAPSAGGGTPTGTGTTPDRIDDDAWPGWDAGAPTPEASRTPTGPASTGPASTGSSSSGGSTSTGSSTRPAPAPSTGSGGLLGGLIGPLLG